MASLTDQLSTKGQAVAEGTGQGLPAEWSVQGVASLASNQYSLIVSKGSPCPDVGWPRAWARMARPACSYPTGGARLCGSPSSTLGVPALSPGCGGGASHRPCGAGTQRSRPPPPEVALLRLVPGFQLAGCPAGLADMRWPRPSSPGRGPPPRCPPSPEPSLMATCSCSSPPCPGRAPPGVSSPGAGHWSLLLRRRQWLARPVCAFKLANDFQTLVAGSLRGAVASTAEGIPRPARHSLASQERLFLCRTRSAPALFPVPQTLFACTGPRCVLRRRSAGGESQHQCRHPVGWEQAPPPVWAAASSSVTWERRQALQRTRGRYRCPQRDWPLAGARGTKPCSCG